MRDISNHRRLASSTPALDYRTSWILRSVDNNKYKTRNDKTRKKNIYIQPGNSNAFFLIRNLGSPRTMRLNTLPKLDIAMKSLETGKAGKQETRKVKKKAIQYPFKFPVLLKANGTRSPIKEMITPKQTPLSKESKNLVYGLSSNTQLHGFRERSFIFFKGEISRKLNHLSFSVPMLFCSSQFRWM